MNEVMKTELRDKYGRKIYEGDVIKIDGEKFEVFRGVDRWNLDNSPLNLSTSFSNYAKGILDKVEIISNIYEILS